MKKLFVSDLDGTLFFDGDNYKNGIHPDNLEAIKDFIAKGNIFAIASARSIKNYPELKEKLGFDVPYICFNGSMISINNEIIYEKYFYLKDYKRIVDFLEENDVDGMAIAVAENTVYRSNSVRYPLNAPDSCDFNQRSYLLFTGIDTSKETYDPNLKCYKILILIRPDILEETKKKLNDKFSKDYTMASSDIDNVDTIPLDTSKGKGIEILQDYYNISRDNCAAIGDSENDLSMYESVTNSFSMENGLEINKKKAKFVVKSVKEALEIFDKNN